MNLTPQQREALDILARTKRGSSLSSLRASATASSVEEQLVQILRR
jgi:hypothetical protein